MNFQVPGRMGMLTVLFLIITSIHANVDGPSGRGFSYIEMWYVGMFIPILVAIFEYAIILVVIKFKQVDGHIQICYFNSKVKVDQRKDGKENTYNELNSEQVPNEHVR